MNTAKYKKNSRGFTYGRNKKNHNRNIGNVLSCVCGNDTEWAEQC